MYRVNYQGKVLMVENDPFKQATECGLSRYLAFLKKNIEMLEENKDDIHLLALSVIASIRYLDVCVKEDKTHSIPRKLQRVIVNCILNRHKMLSETYKDIVEVCSLQ